MDCLGILNDLLPLSARVAEHRSEEVITTSQMEDVLTRWTEIKSPDLDGLTDEFYLSILDFLGGFLANSYSNWQQNRSIYF